MAASLNLLDSVYGQRRAVRTAINEVVLLDKTEIPIFGDIHVLRTEIRELLFLSRTASSWGVSSSVSGVFGDKEFGKVMATFERLHTLLFDDGLSSNFGRNNVAKRSKLFQAHPDHPGQQNEENEELWSLDVAKRWADHTKIKLNGAGYNGIVVAHQDLLRAVNLQEVLIEAILIDPLVARKDGTGTPSDVDESIRRLTMVMRAALSTASAFTYDNRKNQPLLFTKINYLEKLSIPDSLSNFRKHRASITKEIEAQRSLDDQVWSLDLANCAQVLILSILHKNTALCDNVDESLTTMFSSIADSSEDLSTASTLDIIFILVKPGRAPNTEAQLQACKYFLGFSKANGLTNSLALCMKTAAGIIDLEKEVKDDTHTVFAPMLSKNVIHQSETEDNDSSSIHFICPHKPTQKMEDPARLLRLMASLMEGGNERVANLLNQRAGLTIDLTCATIVSHVENELKRVKVTDTLDAIGEEDEEEEEEEEEEKVVVVTKVEESVGSIVEDSLDLDSLEKDFNLDDVRSTSSLNLDDNERNNNEQISSSSSSSLAPLSSSSSENAKDIPNKDYVAPLFPDPYATDENNLDILNIITEEDSVGAALFNLLVEQIFLLPLNRDQLYSTHFWVFIEKVVVPSLEAACHIKNPSEQISETLSELVDLCEFIMITLVRLALYERAIEDPKKERNINDITNTVDEILKTRHATPKILERAFKKSSSEYGIEALNRNQFITMMEKVCHDCEGIDKSIQLTNEIASAYDGAHVSGESALVDLYEFVRLHRHLSSSLQSKEMSKRYLDLIEVKKKGHLLPLRTVESGERIIQIQKGNGASLGNRKFSRVDRYGTRVKQKHSSVQASLFASSHASTTKKFEISKNKLAPRQSQVITSDVDDEEAVKMHEKFEIFQKSLDSNPLISQALQRRRFSMVNILEKGTPGPPDDVGRDLSHYSVKLSASKTGVRGAARVVKRVLTNTGKRRNSAQVAPAFDKVVLNAALDKKRDSLIAHRAGPRGSRGLGERRPSRNSLFQRPKVKSHHTEVEAAAIMIQKAYRRKIAANEAKRVKVIAKPGGGKLANKLSGAIALNWSDIAGRLVRYLSDHFWESGSIAKVNILIIETLLAHLIKSRTYFFDINGLKLTESEIHKAHRLEFQKP
eukprot:CAMPEP_0114386776 /NCGR_PEP_ID=MMETSP0102-20121206/6833_1 /TAXON_ID=38822 ORGANISM="Pteridomonas danica, Strain PT" /NCGR_SAMPLE_ID=MMETSP0102 /ASSEMBLY_ACC=CAM_ASM_000212 /LENGTH=1141 /DNA_ID=CAMNT_0001543687 /DNA_START=1 /DNA_END=3423 /DNA_ORIENTATION=-